MSDEYTRTHPVKVCRDFCAESGYSGDSFHECVKKCVKSIVNKK